MTFSRKFFFWSFCLFFLGISLSTLNPLQAEDFVDAPSKKIALLFITTGDLNHNNFWKQYLQDHWDKFNVYIHSKNSIKDKFFKPFVIPKRVPTSWTNTIKAEKALLTSAYRIPENYKFILLSESCIPLVDPQTLYNTLVNDDKSYFYWTGSGWWESGNPREVLDLPVEHRKGNHMWFTLNRKHAEICVKDKKIIEIIAKYPHDQESYPSSLFSIHGCLEEVVNFGYTYVDWSRPEAGGAHPHAFYTPNQEDFDMLIAARQRGHLFARKFAKKYPSSELKKLIDSER